MPVGGLSLLTAMNAEEQAASYLALWTVIHLLSRGAGIAVGDLLRDIVFSLSRTFATAYAAVFTIEGVGLLVCIVLLHRVDVAGFAQRRKARATALEPLAATAD